MEAKAAIKGYCKKVTITTSEDDETKQSWNTGTVHIKWMVPCVFVIYVCEMVPIMERLFSLSVEFSVKSSLNSTLDFNKSRLGKKF